MTLLSVTTTRRISVTADGRASAAPKKGKEGERSWVAGAKNELEVTRISDREAELTRVFDAPRERVVQTFEYEPLPGHISVDTLTLEDLGEGRTLMRVRSAFGSKEDAEGMVQSGMEAGARETYDRLEELLATKTAA